MSENAHKSPRDLAHIVATKLGSTRGAPDADTLEELFQTLFLASLKSEERRSIKCLLAFAAPNNPDPTPPERIRLDRWVYSALGAPVLLTPGTLAKLALATDPLISALAVHARSGRRPQIHGLFDQQRGYQAMLQYEREGGYSPPGVFQVQIAGLGHLVVMKDSVVLGELRDGALAPATQDVLGAGPVVQFFGQALEMYLARMFALARTSGRKIDDSPADMAIEEWLRSLRRILIRAQAHGRGASFVFSKEQLGPDVRPRYAVKYDRLRVALDASVAARLEERFARDDLEPALESGADNVPALAHLNYEIASDDVEDAENTIDGAVEFIAALSRVDGAVVLQTDLTLLGFGAEILCPDLTQDVFLARFPRPTGRTVVDLQRFGTRHRSALRYCAAHPGAVAFVVSEDGPVRAMMHTSNRLWLWDNVQLRDVRDGGLPDLALRVAGSELSSDKSRSRK